MKSGITFRNIDSNRETIDYIKHRLAFVFARTQHEIDRAKIIVSDLNGPKGGVDKQCKIVLSLPGQQPIVVSERRETLRQAIDRCLYRASQSLNRRLKLQRIQPKKRPRITALFGSATDTSKVDLQDT